ncbi:MAG TPA: ATP-binding protein [Oceanipulchritudo sp.]|nr:ATP-binding protein [Oceanipulchritudo sp.]
MGAFPEPNYDPSSRSKSPETGDLVCPEDVDWIFDVDSLKSAGRDALIREYALDEPPSDCPHHPFNLSGSSIPVWDQTLRKLSMASGESHLVLTAHCHAEAHEIVFYTRVAGYREEGLPRIAATFQRIDQSSYQSVADNVRQNWLYLLHEIKNPLSLLKQAEDLAEEDGPSAAEAAQTRRFAISSLEQHLQNGVFLATEDSKLIPNRPKPLDLYLFFEEIRESFALLLRLQDNHLDLTLDIEAFRVARIDRTLLTQLLNNILLNKLNLLSGQTLRIICSLVSSRSDGTGTLLSISIEDEGPAFPDHILQDLEQETDMEGLLRIQKNSGLGLPICRRIASVMGAEMHLYNDPPKTRIRLLIPLG